MFVAADYLNHLHFTRVIIDDANEVSETLALMAFVKNCQKLVLVGDIAGKAPVHKSYLALSKGANMSIFEKLIR